MDLNPCIANNYDNIKALEMKLTDTFMDKINNITDNVTNRCDTNKIELQFINQTIHTYSYHHTDIINSLTLQV